MDTLATTDVFLFEGFRLDRSGGGLFLANERGDFVAVSIGSRALDILGVLVERAGDLVSKEELIAAVWPGTVIEESNLTVQIAALRRVLDQGRSEGSLIQTITGRGYRFLGAVTRVKPEAGSHTASNSVGDGCTTGIADAPSAEVPTPMPTGMGGRRWVWRGVAAVLIVFAVTELLVTTHYWWLGSAVAPPRLSMIVLPFTNLGNKPGRGVFRRRDHRRPNHRSFADFRQLRDRPQHRLYL
jgi:DNA-binding winged helix-turn-helix (wHTH) protein